MGRMGGNVEGAVANEVLPVRTAAVGWGSSQHNGWVQIWNKERMRLYMSSATNGMMVRLRAGIVGSVVSGTRKNTYLNEGF
jgi:hypothetical protein